MNTYAIIVEHTAGQSVSHPCRNGVYPDPTDQMPSTICAECESDAEDIARERLSMLVSESSPCDCRRRRAPGSEAWWGSVAISAIPAAAAAQPQVTA